MDSFLTPSNIMFVLGLLAIIFSVYNYFRNPQIKADKTDALLEQKLLWERQSNDKQFTEMGQRITVAMTLSENHIHTVDVKVDKLIEVVALMNVTFSTQLKELSTIINERIPRK